MLWRSAHVSRASSSRISRRRKRQSAPPHGGYPASLIELPWRSFKRQDSCGFWSLYVVLDGTWAVVLVLCRHPLVHTHSFTHCLLDSNEAANHLLLPHRVELRHCNVILHYRWCLLFDAVRQNNAIGCGCCCDVGGIRSLFTPLMDAWPCRFRYTPLCLHHHIKADYVARQITS